MATRTTHMRSQLHENSFAAQEYEKRADRTPQITTIAHMRKTFVNDWGATKVTTWNKADAPIGGEILKHHPNKRAVYQAAKNYLAQHPTARLFIFFAGDPIPQDVEAMLALC